MHIKITRYSTHLFKCSRKTKPYKPQFTILSAGEDTKQEKLSYITHVNTKFIATMASSLGDSNIF